MSEEQAEGELEYFKESGELPVQEYSFLDYRADDSGMMDAWVDHHGKDWLFDEYSNEWMQWLGGRWERRPKGAITRTVIELLRSAHDEAYELAEEIDSEIFEIDTNESLTKIGKQKAKRPLQKKLKQIQARMSVAKPGERNVKSIRELAASVNVTRLDLFDAGNKLNLSNGTIDLDTLEFYPHNRDDLLTIQLDYGYDPDAQCPTFMQYLNSAIVTRGGDDTWVADHPTIDLLQEMVGYSLTTDTSYPMITWLWGVGGAGKSVLINVIGSLAGQLADTVDFNGMSDDKRNEQYKMAALKGKRIAMSTESEDGNKINMSLLKKAVDGSMVDARHPAGRPFSYKSTLHVWWAMNVMPPLSDQGYSVERRLKIVPMLRSFAAEGTSNADLPQLLEAELPGILNWALVGLKRLMENGGFTESKLVNETTRRKLDESSPLRSWFADHCEKSKSSTSAKELHEHYCEYATERGHYPLAHQRFCETLINMNIREVKPKNVRSFKVTLSRIATNGELTDMFVPQERVDASAEKGSETVPF